MFLLNQKKIPKIRTLEHWSWVHVYDRGP